MKTEATHAPTVYDFEYKYPEWAQLKFGWKERTCSAKPERILEVIDKGFNNWYGLTRFMFAGRPVVDFSRTRDTFQVTVYYAQNLLRGQSYFDLCLTIESLYTVQSIFNGPYSRTYTLTYF